MSAGFVDRLDLTLTVTIEGTAYAINGGCIEAFELRATLHGFEGYVEFVLLDDADYGGGFTDELADAFIEQDLAEVALEFKALWDQAEADESPDPVSVTGYVRDRWLEELQIHDTPNLPILARRYRVEFVDAAKLLWTQHFPTELYTDSTIEDAINAHLGDKITLTYDWSVSSETLDMWFIHLPRAAGASFYDFVLWYADTRGGYFAYDYATPGYTLKGSRDVSGTAASMFGDDLARVRMRIGDTPRHNLQVLNSYAESPTTTLVEQAQVATGMREDLVVRSTIAADVEAEVTTQTARLLVPMYEAELEFGRMPIVCLTPGQLLSMPASNRWTEGSKLVDLTWFVRELYIHARASKSPIDGAVEIDDRDYSIELRARLMQSEDTRPVHPRHAVPRYPGYIEGLVKSTLGEEDDKTYENNRNEDTSIDEYTVKIPLWSDQEISAPFIPAMGSGNVYLPSYRDERVLMALSIDHARISRLLEWREGAALSKDVQGEQILWGKNATSNTSVNHVYEDDDPVFNVERTNSTDTSIIKLSEGSLYMRVEELDE